MHKVSIILPTHNGSRFICEFIQSCLSQSLTDFELVVVDDGSTDDTALKVMEYTDPRIRLIKHLDNQKLPAALNTGFSHAQGDYFIWMSDDDQLHPMALETLTNYLDLHPEADAVYGDYCQMDENGSPGLRIKLDEQNPKQPLCTPAFLYRRKLYSNLGGYKPECFLFEDYEFWLQVWCRYRMDYLPAIEPYYYHRERSGSLTDRYKWWVHEQSVKLRRKLLRLSWLEYQRQLAYVHIEAAYEAHRNARWKEVQHRSFQAVCHNPFWLLDRGFLSINRTAITAILIRK